METVPQSQPEHELSAACKDARAHMNAGVLGAAGSDANRALRAHVAECSACRRSYVDALSAAGRLGRALRSAQQRHEERERDERVQRGSERAQAREQRGRALRRLALPGAAGLALLVLALPQRAARSLELERISGNILLPGHVLGPELERARLWRGDWIATEGNATVRMLGENVEFELGPASRALLEDPGSGRVRLASGNLLANGTCVLTHPLGLLLVTEGRARVRASEHDFEVEAQAGRVVLCTSAGERALPPGERVLLAR
jgi:hypothetical protein